MVQADILFLMTDVDCLYDKNPRIHPEAQPIEVVEDIDSLAVDVSSAGSALGTGGMSTKIVAARLATSAGVTTIITRSSSPGNILGIVQYVQAMIGSSLSSSSSSSVAEIDQSHSTNPHASPLPLKPPLHTRFLPDPQPIRDRSFWILYGLAPCGTLYIDEGAHRALISKAGLLPAGVVHVGGAFASHEAVRIFVIPDQGSTSTQRSSHHQSDHAHSSISPAASLAASQEVGRALVNYSAAEIARIKGLQSTEILSVLGYADSEYVALRENISLARKDKSRPVTPTPSASETASHRVKMTNVTERTRN